MVDRTKAIELVDQLRLAVPKEVRAAEEVLAQKDHILNLAQTEARRTKSTAEDEYRERLNKHELVNQAEQRAMTILRDAEERARRMVEQAETQSQACRTEADAYALRVRRRIHGHAPCRVGAQSLPDAPAAHGRVAAVRWMAGRGQSSDPALPSFSPDRLPLVAGAIELVGEDDPLAGGDGEHAGKVKVRAWRGPERIADPRTDVAGVGWILAERWWPYQRPTFVTPPFAGYVSGHSTVTRLARPHSPRSPECRAGSRPPELPAAGGFHRVHGVLPVFCGAACPRTTDASFQPRLKASAIETFMP